jgi:hypothetical protein
MCRGGIHDGASVLIVGDFSNRAELAGRVKSCWVRNDGAEGYGIGALIQIQQNAAPGFAVQGMSDSLRSSVCMHVSDYSGVNCSSPRSLQTVMAKNMTSCSRQLHVHGIIAVCKVELTLRLVGAEREAGGVGLWSEFFNVRTGIFFI